MRYLYITILLTASVLLSAENQLDIVWEMQSEQPSIDYGKYVTALDFNGDGFDDLAVSAPRYIPNEEFPDYKGKLYIYFGSEDGLPNNPTLTVTAEVDTTLEYTSTWISVVNLGDMNSDGCEDLGFRYGGRWHDQSGYHFFENARILLGSNEINPDSAYSYECGLSSEIHPLGDINGDGYDDAGITEELSNTLTYSIVYGGTFEKVTFVEGIYTRNGKGFRGLGDVNGDGFDDFGLKSKNWLL